MKKTFLLLSFIFCLHQSDAKIERPESKPHCELSQIKNLFRTMNDFMGSEWFGYHKISQHNEQFIEAIIKELGMDDYCIEIRQMSKYAEYIFGHLNAFVMPSIFFNKKSHSYLYLAEDAFNLLSNNAKEALIKHELMHLKYDHVRKLVNFNTVSGMGLCLINFIAQQYIAYKKDQNQIYEKTAKFAQGSIPAVLYVGWLLSKAKFSRLCEKEADIEAAKTMKDSRDFISIIDALDEEYGEVESKFKIKRIYYAVCKILLSPIGYIAHLLSTHPTLEQRRTYIENL